MTIRIAYTTGQKVKDAFANVAVANGAGLIAGLAAAGQKPKDAFTADAFTNDAFANGAAVVAAAPKPNLAAIAAGPT